MKHFKKHPIFAALFILLLAVFVGGIVYDAVLFSENEEAVKNERKARSRYESAIGRDPGEASLKAADANLAALNERLNILDKDLSRDSSKILSPCPVKEGYALVEHLRSMIGQWRLEASEKSIIIPENFDFSFKRYFESNAKPPSDDAVGAIWKQANILNYILGKLYASKPDKSPMSIVSIQREVLPQETDLQPAARTGRSTRTARATRSVNTGDTFKVDQFITSRKPGSISALGYKIVFTGYTETMRRFLTELNSFDLMLVVRSVEVKPYVGSLIQAPAAASASTPEFSFDTPSEGSDAAAVPEEPAVSKDPVVSENISEFTFVIEYVEVDKTQPAAPAPESAEDEDGEKEGE